MTANVLPLKTAIGRWSRDVHSQALDTMIRTVPPYAPIGQGPTRGELRRSIRRDRAAVSFSADRIRGRIVAPVIQARTTDQGSPPHIIRPRRAGGLLVFQWHGRKVAYRFVHHPGNQPKPWWQRALRATWGPSLRAAAIRTPLRR